MEELASSNEHRALLQYVFAHFGVAIQPGAEVEMLDQDIDQSDVTLILTECHDIHVESGTPYMVIRGTTIDGVRLCIRARAMSQGLTQVTNVWRV